MTLDAFDDDDDDMVAAGGGLADGMHTLDDGALPGDDENRLEDHVVAINADGDGDDDEPGGTTEAEDGEGLSDDGFSGYGPEGADFTKYRNIERERGFNGSRHDFKRTKPLYTDEQFHAQPLGFRVGAILSDGQWYTAEKIRKYCRHDDIDDIQDIIDNMLENDMVVSSDSGESYRMTYDQMHDWRMEHGIPMDAQIIQSILYPRLITVGSKTVTEQEAFLPVKRHRFGSVKFTLKDDADINDIIDNLGYIGRFVHVGYLNRWVVMCLSADWAKKKLEEYEKERGGKGHVFVDTGRERPGIYNNGLQRDLNEMDPRALEQIVRFYQTFRTMGPTGEIRPAMLQPSSYRTMQVYLDDGRGDSGVMAQLDKWIIDAIQHYDERCGSPFAAYLQMVANRRVNDIPKTVIGEELAEFQNMKAKAVKALNRKHGEGDYFTGKQIVSQLHEDFPSYDIDEERFARLDKELSTWKQMRHMEGLQWDETGEEKRFDLNRTGNAVDRQRDMAGSMNERNASTSRIQHAVVKAAIRSGSSKDARIMLMMLANSSSLGSALMGSMSAMLSDDYRDALAVALDDVKG